MDNGGGKFLTTAFGGFCKPRVLIRNTQKAFKAENYLKKPEINMGKIEGKALKIAYLKPVIGGTFLAH